jgi:hypothetical protein
VQLAAVRNLDGWPGEIRIHGRGCEYRRGRDLGRPRKREWRRGRDDRRRKRERGQHGRDDRRDHRDRPDTATDTGDATDTDDSPPVVDPDRPVIVSIDLPDEVYAAGPVALSVQTKFTGAARVMLDGADAGTLIDAGDGLFKGELPVLGAIDNGPHAIEVIATAGPYEARKPDSFEVKAPKPGTEAWSQAGPAGSRTNRVAVTPEGDLIEGGQTELGGVPQPTIRKRSGVNGDELWTVVLDTREGAVVDVAVLPDGRMWVAMNVREPMKDSRPRIALLDADGHATGRRRARHRRPRRPRHRGRRERRLLRRGRRGRDGRLGLRLLADRRGGRADARRRVRLPCRQFWILPHKFRDLASDVVIDGDVAWVVGLSQGQHEDVTTRTRGVLVPMDLHTGELVGPVIVAPMDGQWWHSAFFGGALHPDGVLVTGYGCDEMCDLYRIETSLYTAAGRAHVARERGLERRPGLRQRRRVRQPGARARGGRRDAERQAARLRVRSRGQEQLGDRDRALVPGHRPLGGPRHRPRQLRSHLPGRLPHRQRRDAGPDHADPRVGRRRGAHARGSLRDEAPACLVDHAHRLVEERHVAVRAGVAAQVVGEHLEQGSQVVTEVAVVVDALGSSGSPSLGGKAVIASMTTAFGSFLAAMTLSYCVGRAERLLVVACCR